jgi:hypothetical protein
MFSIRTIGEKEKEKTKKNYFYVWKSCIFFDLQMRGWIENVSIRVTMFNVVVSIKIKVQQYLIFYKIFELKTMLH